MKDICDGHSITLTYPEQRIVSSAIVGGIIPIALGVALNIKRRGGSETVWAFIGDMTARTGVSIECHQYAMGHDLPMRIIVEDNCKSVGTVTPEAWGMKESKVNKFELYQYKLPHPHSGAGKWVEF
jgi:pyruvate dehydrogenase E1 component alpha subunit